MQSAAPEKVKTCSPGPPHLKDKKKSTVNIKVFQNFT